MDVWGPRHVGGPAASLFEGPQRSAYLGRRVLHATSSHVNLCVSFHPQPSAENRMRERLNLGDQHRLAQSSETVSSAAAQEFSV